MIKESILEKLVSFTDEEIDSLNGHYIIDKSIFLNSQTIDYHKILKDKQLISVRKHARFFDYPLHSHNYIEMSYVYDGNMRHIIEGKKVVIHKGEMILLNRDIEHAIEKTGENDIIFNFIIHPDFFDYISVLSDGNVIFNFILNTLYSHQQTGQYLLFHSANNETIKDYVEEIISHVYEPEITSGVKLKLMVGLLLMELIAYPDMIESYQNDGYDKILCTSVLNYISKEYRQGTLQDIALQLHQKDYHLSKLMKLHTGYTFKQHMINMKMEKAIDLLENTGLSILDIGNEIGYENQTHFYKVFKTKYLMTPYEYRISIKNKKEKK